MAALLQKIVAIVALMSFASTPLSARFTCPPSINFKCDCSIVDGTDTDVEIDDRTSILDVRCLTNATSKSAFDLMIHESDNVPRSLVRIECENLPNWTDFVLGSKINVGSVRILTISSCLPLGDFDGKKIRSEFDVSDVEKIVFEDAQGALTASDTSIFSEVRDLTLSSNHLGRVSADLIKNLSNLERLELRETQIDEIPATFFEKASSLIELDLGENKLNNLKPGTFDGLKNIKNIILGENEFTEFDAELFRNLTSLVWLSISSNKLVTLPAEIFHDLVNLVKIDFGSNNFTSLPENLFENNRHLKIVEFSLNKVNLTTLPARLFANKSELRDVSLTRIGLLCVPENVFWESYNLRELKIDENYLTTLPVYFFKDAIELRVLSMRFNNLKELPDGLFLRTKRLRKLDLSRNHLTSITEKTFLNLTSLTELNFERNDLIKIHNFAFSSLVKLRVAKFASNKLDFHNNSSHERSSVFHPCHTTLEELHLSYNNVSEIFEDWINSPRIRKLDLSYNRLQFLQVKDLQFISNRVNVDLRYNLIREVNFDGLKSVSSNQTTPRNISVDLFANPIRCDCRVYTLLRYISSEIEQHALNYVALKLENLTCHGPHFLRNIHLRDIELNKFKCLVKNKSSKPGDPCSFHYPCNCWRIPANKTLKLDCAAKNLTKAPEWINTTGVESIELDLAGNKLEIAPSLTDIGYDKVNILNLANNNIRFINESLVTTNLKVLNLDGNNLTTIDINALQKFGNISNLTIHNNPWGCGCDSWDFINFVQSNFSNVSNRSQIVCSNSKVPLSYVNLKNVCPFHKNLIIILSTVISVSVLGGLVAFYLYCRFYRFANSNGLIVNEANELN